MKNCYKFPGFPVDNAGSKNAKPACLHFRKSF